MDTLFAEPNKLLIKCIKNTDFGEKKEQLKKLLEDQLKIKNVTTALSEMATLKTWRKENIETNKKMCLADEYLDYCFAMLSVENKLKEVPKKEKEEEHISQT